MFAYMAIVGKRKTLAAVEIEEYSVADCAALCLTVMGHWNRWSTVGPSCLKIHLLLAGNWLYSRGRVGLAGAGHIERFKR